MQLCRWPVLWLRALRWNWAQIEWSTEGMNSTFDVVPCVPWLLLARDFSLATHVQITDVAGQPMYITSSDSLCAKMSGSSCSQWWPWVQTFPVLLFESCGIVKLAWTPRSTEARATRICPGFPGWLRFLKNPHRHDKPVRSWSALSLPVAGRPLWD